MFKKFLSMILSISLISAGSTVLLGNTSLGSLVVSAKEKGVADYTYTITPLLSPFNEYFFVKTDNPDPTSFRFADKSSKYSEDSTITFDWDDWDEKVQLYADIKYENQDTGRVNGGYIFKSYNTDGGEIILQSKNDAYYSWDVTWSDTEVKLELPALKDDTDYLIDTYATESRFFDNMDAVQSGFSSICLYSGSFIRGELYKSGSFWSLSTSPHKDQTFYLQSPYSRKDNKSLFATAIYPFRYDSLGFPSMMAEVSQRLDSSSTYKWDENSHADINVTYNGETHMYGGQGYGEGQGISEDKIKQYFTFGTNGTKITLESVRQLLDDYSEIEMSDDIPRTDALTWEKVCNKVESGSWVRLINIYSIFGGSDTGYTYLYKKNDGENHWTDSAGSNGSEIYLDGDMGYLSDAWVDGRYIDAWEEFVLGEKFEDHPTSDIMLTDVTIPQISYDYTYRYNSTIYGYEKVYDNINITEKTENVLFSYDEDSWKAEYNAFDYGCATYSTISEMVEKGLIDEKYLDMVTLTLDEVKTLEVDKNTNIVPLKGYIYDGTAEPGTPYEIISLTDSNVNVTLSSSIFTYNGEVQLPKVSVTYKGKALEENTDYTLTYSDKYSKTAGEYTIEVEGIGGYTGTVEKSYMIVPPATSIKLDTSSLNLTVGESSTLKAITDPTEASSGVIWTSSNTNVATVSNGSVQAVGKGIATITAKTSNGKTATCTVTVSVAVTGISLNNNTLKMNKGETSVLTATITPSDAGNKTITWTSSNNAVATVSNGEITAKSAGTTTITAKTNNGKTATCVVTVVVPESEVTLNKTAVIMTEGKSVTITATVLPSDATDKTVTWKSSDQNIATVSDGKITAKHEGTAVITVTSSSGKTATCKIIVKSKDAKVVSGDVNGDGTTDIADSLLIASFDVGFINLTQQQIIEADINEDGSVDIADALMIARYDAGLIDFLL